jgi:lipid II:glycine glycyltransferase (peptidoglycan interpeptide bridge formation enzyme)
VASGAGLDAALAAVSELAAEVGADQARVEPVGEVTEQALRERGWRRAAKDVQPSLTWVKELRGTSEDLLRDMYKSNRVRYRTAAQRGLSFEVSREPGDVEVFIDMVHEVAARTRIAPHRDEYYRTMARALMPREAMTLYLARYEGDPVAGVVVFDGPAVRYTVHSGSFPVARKLHAASPLRTQIILDAHAAGKRWLDFWGVAPADQPDHRWAGFTRFKQSFGGDYLRYAGTWELGSR